MSTNVGDLDSYEIINTYDFVNQKYTMENVVFDKKTKEHTKKTLFNMNFEGHIITFNNINKETINLFLISTYTPDFGNYEYIEKEYLTNINSEEAVDIIKEKYYSELERVYIPWTTETKENYSKMVGFEVPNYYYKDGNEILFYFNIEKIDNDFKHTICSENGKDNFKFYIILDSTGKIIQ